MKNYRKLVPIVMVILMAVSIYNMVSSAKSQNDELKKLIIKAQECDKQGLTDRAVSYYKDAINIKKDFKYYIKIFDILYDSEEYDAAKKWCEKILEDFPKNSTSYEKMIQVCMELEKYTEAYKTLDDYDGRSLTSEVIEKYREDLEFVYYDEYLGIDNVSQSSAGYVGVCVKDKWGLSDTNGSNKVQPEFSQIGYFANGIVPVYDKDNVWYFMNEYGEYELNISDSVGDNISEVGLYNEDVFPVCVNGVYSYYDKDFKKQIGDFEYAGSFSEGVAAVKDNGEWKLINNKGQDVSKEVYKDVIMDERGICCNKERIFVKKDNEYIMIDSSGKHIGEESFEEAKIFVNDDYTAIKKNGLWGYADVSGKIVIEPEYQDAQSFSMGLAAVLKDGKWGYIDISDKFVIEPEYNQCHNFSSKGTAFVQNNSYWGIIKLYKYNH